MSDYHTRDNSDGYEGVRARARERNAATRALKAEHIADERDAAGRAIAAITKQLDAINRDKSLSAEEKARERTKAVVFGIEAEILLRGLVKKLGEGDPKVMQIYLQMLGFLRAEEKGEAAPPSFTFNFVRAEATLPALPAEEENKVHTVAFEVSRAGDR